jgi:PHD/YefM family antitoxin component YafN of YafNO toxin-antitoxin module
MKVLSSTEVRQNFSTVLSDIKVEPISISKHDKEIAVIMSTERYSELTRLEDMLYGKAAELAIKKGFPSKKEEKEIQDLMNSIA